MSMLYLQVIVHTRSIKCIRDIEPKHLPLLRSIRKNAEDAICSKYGVPRGELRMFVHYQPSFCRSPSGLVSVTASADLHHRPFPRTRSEYLQHRSASGYDLTLFRYMCNAKYIRV